MKLIKQGIVGYMSQVNLIENYCKNPNEIVRLAEKHSDKFSMRTDGDAFEFKTKYGTSNMKSMFHTHMPEELLDAVWKTIPEDKTFVESVTLNRYDPGDSLPRHKDSVGSYWKFKLVFLQSDKPHFKWYDDKGNGHLVDEVPGAVVDMPIDLEHEVTEIEKEERPKYSLVLAWGA
jgi:hypothetical protein